MLTSAELAAERERVLAAREERDRPVRMLHRARRALQFRWNASPEELREGIGREWPNMPPAEIDELLAVTLEVQRTERRSITPEPKREATVPTEQKTDKERITDFVRNQLRNDRDLNASTVCERVKSLLGLEVTLNNFYKGYWGPVRKELGIRGPGKQKPLEVKRDEPTKTEKRGPAPAVEPIPSTNGGKRPEVAKAEAAEEAERDEQLSDAVHGNGAAVLEEVRSLRATYEAGDFIRLEDQDGEWRLIVGLTFETRHEAAAALAALAGAASQEWEGA